MPSSCARLVVAALAVCGLMAGAAGAQPLSIERFGSFHVGGRLVEVTGKPVIEFTPTVGGAPLRIDPNGTYLVGRIYAQVMEPAPRRGAVPLMLWHGGGLTGACWETTPDGREGWQHFFLRRGWATWWSPTRWNAAAPAGCASPRRPAACPSR